MSEVFIDPVEDCPELAKLQRQADELKAVIDRLEAMRSAVIARYNGLVLRVPVRTIEDRQSSA